MKLPLLTRAVLACALLLPLAAGCSNPTADVPVEAAVISTPVVEPSSSVTASVADVEAYPALPGSTPTRVRVPSIGVDTDLMSLGLNADNTLEVPPEGFPAGWFTGAPTPGELGPAVIAGHVDWTTGPAVFYDLHRTKVGDDILVDREDGSTVVFTVLSVEKFSKEEFPTERVYGNLDHAGLRLITCGGKFDWDTGHYVDNVVVFAEMKV